MMRVLAVGLALAAAALGFFGYRLYAGAASTAERSSEETLRRPDFTLQDLAGNPQAVSQWDGRVLVVNFWATWCEPCRREIPLLDTLQAEYRDRDVQFVGVAIDNVEDVRKFVETTPIGYTVLVGEQDAVDALAGFGAEMTVLPYTAFVARDGRVATLHAGEIQRAEAVRVLDELL
jgi:thiol-disulfide isomerase/thioredoxin